MDYGRIYEQLIARSMCREVRGYTERHHIVPRCLGGSDDPANLVRLTAKEHFLAHKLLVRMYPHNKGVWYALIAMGRIPEFKSRIFASERARAADARRGTVYSVESRQKMSLIKKGRPSNSPATRFKPGHTSWNTGMSGEQHHMYGTKRTDEQRKRMSEAQKACGNVPPSRKGAKMTEEQKARAREKRALTKQSKLLER